MSVVNVNQLAQFYMPKLEEFVKTNLTKRLKDKHVFFTDGSTKALYEDTRVDEASGTMRQVVDGADAPGTTINDGYSKRRFLRKYMLAIEYTDLVMRTANREQMLKISRVGSDAPHQLLADKEAAYFELADTAIASVPKIGGMPMVDTLAADGQPIASTAHTFKSTDTVTYSNKTSTYTSLTQDSLWDAINTVRGWKNNLEDYLDITCTELIVGFPNHKKAVELLRSVDDSETTNRSTNALRSEHNLKLTLYNRMPSPTEWALKTTAENDFKFKFLYKPETKRDEIIRRGIHMIVMSMALSEGVGDPRAMFFNKV